ncbi:MAG: FYDLN acid domain-containing protein [Alphaproteobacteria bacterium]|nr:FYDLN acid domain-containing protein [Alphaproteobacteria bacterium]
MSTLTQAVGRGRKHRCAACGAAFYDLERELTACPKCETPYGASAHMPRGEPARKRSWSKSARRAEPEAGAEAPAADAREENNDGVPILDTVDDAEQAEDREEGEDGEEASDAAKADDA